MYGEIGLVFVYGSITALGTGLGALPFLFVRNISEKVIAYAEAIATGLMLGASFGLIVEGTAYGAPQTLAGAAIGVLFIQIGHQYLHGKDVQFGSMRGAGARRVFLVIAVMTIHSFSEGVAVGVAFGGGQKLAALITIAIAVHNIPEGLAIQRGDAAQGSDRALLRRVERFLLSPPAPHGGPGLRLRGCVPAGPSLRPRLRGRGHGLHGVPRTHARGLRKGEQARHRGPGVRLPRAMLLFQRYI